ncbi:hypothetical protein HDE_09412 [Halotydeus destructor]|nr:hypothetical protein HDE_09412 [Halotydeus destructor]
MEAKCSCSFIALKYAILVFLAVNFASLEEKNPTPVGVDHVTPKKLWSTITASLNIIFVLIALLGVARENYGLSMLAAILMAIDTVASFYASFLVDWTVSSIVSLVINILVTVMAYAFASMCKKRLSTQVTPITNGDTSMGPMVVI